MQQRDQYRAAVRDSQKGRVYAAERSLGWWDAPEHFARFADLSRFVKRLANSRRLAKDFPEFRRYGAFQLIESPRGEGACADAYELTFRPGSWRRWLAIHEFAHTIHKREIKDAAAGAPPKDVRWTGDVCGYMQGHGWRYCQIYLKLILWFEGRAAHDALKAAFKAKRVRYKTPRVISPEQKLVLANRLRRMRGQPIALAA